MTKKKHTHTKQTNKQTKSNTEKRKQLSESRTRTIGLHSRFVDQWGFAYWSNRKKKDDIKVLELVVGCLAPSSERAIFRIWEQCLSWVIQSICLAIVYRLIDDWFKGGAWGGSYPKVFSCYWLPPPSRRLISQSQVIMSLTANVRCSFHGICKKWSIIIAVVVGNKCGCVSVCQQGSSCFIWG